MLTVQNSLVSILSLASLVLLTCACGACVVLIGWRGKWAGIVLACMVLACGLIVLVATTIMLPRYWWLSLLPILLGIQGIRVWRQQPAPRGISLGSLILMVGFVAAVLAGIGQLHRHWELERAIVAKIEALIDGQVEYDFDGLAIGVVVYEVQPESLDQLLSLLRQLKYVRRLQLNHSSLSLEQAKQIGDIRSLEQLWLQGANLDDQKLEQIGRLSNLQSLDLMDNQFSGKGLKYLWNAQRLRNFWQNSDAITPEDVELLRAKLPRLETW